MYRYTCTSRDGNTQLDWSRASR